MTRDRATKPADVTCPSCGDYWTTETKRSWWHWSDRCYACQEPRGDGSLHDA